MFRFTTLHAPINRCRDHFLEQPRHSRNRYLAAQSTADIIGGNRGRTTSRNTVRNRLRDRGISCRRPYRGPILTRSHRLDRQQWAKINRGRSWRNVCCFFAMSHALTFLTLMAAYGCTGRNERYADNCVCNGELKVFWRRLNFSQESGRNTEWKSWCVCMMFEKTPDTRIHVLVSKTVRELCKFCVNSP